MGGYRYRSVISGAEFTKWFARLDFERFKKGKGGAIVSPSVDGSCICRRRIFILNGAIK
jgi:hypothetical protein